MTVIIGIDPGSRRTGYGVIRLEGNRHVYLASGYLNLLAFPAHERLRQIYLGLQKIMQTYQPHEAAIEQVFMQENPNSALKLGQARGAAIVALDIPVAEYSARAVKKSVVGHGAADKSQVQFMVKRLLNIGVSLQPDAADALAVALCHAHARGMKKWGIEK
ncbi:Crossover junction endodeoxyribonuclease RuvC [Aquicella siphonis]|uniref:Crossover junction endodeoxyribonuclease RuvC n=1 Tax=Aquicella siphonis TaxID=254247 RepID=A0A5E4PFL3_9COXI|nr:crossover junction endodeoxyribonuclease RuvC [Aquicella siphonis]VVC75292.1 Crossover junction endodeoxyribonuclease RuvC [Aquicella siphonis]